MSIQPTNGSTPLNTGVEKLAAKFDKACNAIADTTAKVKIFVASALEKKTQDPESPREVAVEEEGAGAKFKHFIEGTTDRIKGTFGKEEGSVKVEPQILSPPTEDEIEAFSSLARFITLFQDHQEIKTIAQYNSICEQARDYMGSEVMHPLRPAFRAFQAKMQPKLGTLLT